MSVAGQATDPRWFREVLGQYPTGVCVVTAADDDGGRAGFVVGSFTSVSLDPPLVAFFPDKASTSWPRIRTAGRFCVNVLGESQEDVCRRFAAKAEDKFGDLACRATERGSPIIDGAVAWLDCDLESEVEAGDHYSVLARVHELDIGSRALPLLFFQGGYGRFAPLSMAAGRGTGLRPSQLRDVDLVRPEMERVAADLGARCIATAPLDADELVVIASAGAGNTRAPATLVGQHLPFAPPTCTVFVAWRGEREIDRWLDGRKGHRDQVAVVRERGFSLGLADAAMREFASVLDRLAAKPQAQADGRLREMVAELSYDTAELTPATKRRIRTITVPVFDTSGDVALALTVYGYANPTAAGGIDAYIERVLQAGARATDLLAPAR